MFSMVLVHPRIAQNVGNIARLCAANQIPLHLIKPYGFILNDKHLKRAGLDYWDQVTLVEHDSWEKFMAERATLRQGSHQTSGGQAGRSGKDKVWLITKYGEKCYWEVSYQKGDYLVFGSEESGLPTELLKSASDRCLKIPMSNKKVRCLNLATSAGIVLYEALRQQGR